MSIRAVVAVTAVIAGGLIVVLSTGLGRPAAFDPVAVLGKPAPQGQMALLDGHHVDLQQLRGKAVLVNFWNSWCEPCQQEAPALDEFYTQHKSDADFELVGIVHDDTTSAARRWVQARGIGWPIALDPQSQTALAFGTTGQPETYAISPAGVIVAKRVGAATVDDLTRMLAMARGQA